MRNYVPKLHLSVGLYKRETGFSDFVTECLNIKSTLCRVGLTYKLILNVTKENNKIVA